MYRYWDGAQWTEHRAPRTVPAAPVVRAASAPPTGKIKFPKQGGKVRGGARVVAPTVEEILAGCHHEDPRHPLEEQVEVTGETYYAKGIKRVFAHHGVPIGPSGSTLEDLTCVLVPNPWNPHDPNAVAICVSGHQVGHLPAEMCPDYSPLLLALARQEILATGEARIWAKDEKGMIRARVTILIPEAVALR
jgi:hypothetical protein